MSLSRILKNDTVVVRSGRDRGRKGRVLAIWPTESRVLVEKVNVVKRATKPNPRTGQGGIIEKEAPLHWSRVQLICPKCEKPTRLGSKVLPSGSFSRACRRCGEVIE